MSDLNHAASPPADFASLFGTLIFDHAVMEARRAATVRQRGPSNYDVVDTATGQSHGIYDTLDEARGCVAFDRLAFFEIWHGDTIVERSDDDPPLAVFAELEAQRERVLAEQHAKAPACDKCGTEADQPRLVVVRNRVTQQHVAGYRLCGSCIQVVEDGGSKKWDRVILQPSVPTHALPLGAWGRRNERSVPDVSSSHPPLRTFAADSSTFGHIIEAVRALEAEGIQVACTWYRDAEGLIAGVAVSRVGGAV